jgi:tRNA pseudouridine38-40 synthase
MRYFIRIRYRGTAYHGWQMQPNAITVQEVLDEAMSKILREPISTLGCGRTDTGVHASDFYAHFDVSLPIENLDFILQRLSAMRLKGIQICEIIPVPENAHARFDAISRTYEYRISLTQDPFIEGLTHYIHTPINVEVMNEATQYLLGKNDFSAFSKSNTQVFTNNCDIKFAHWKKDDQLLVFTIKADRFLRNMVRAIVGTMLEIGQGKIAPADMAEIIKSGDRSNAGMSVAAQGLFLTKVEYPEGYFDLNPL